MKEILRKALETWGPEAQTLMVFEEMAELQKELCKHARGKDNRLAIAEEIADVIIMLEQMILLHNCVEDVFRIVDEKMERLEKRLQEREHELQEEKEREVLHSLSHAPPEKQ